MILREFGEQPQRNWRDLKGNPLVILREFEEKSKGIGADLAGTAGGRGALAAHTSHAQHTFTQTTQIHQDNRLGLVKNVALVEYRYFQSHMLCV